MSHRFLHVGFHNFEVTEQIATSLGDTFNYATDWCKYSPNCWILWTGLTADEWNARIGNTPGMPATYGALIAPIDLTPETRGGKTYDWVWKWLNKKR